MSGSIWVIVAQTKGSAPREAGAAMEVWSDRIAGSIGGGALEWSAIAHARFMLAEGKTDDRRQFALGPDMGQCCGGAVTLDFSTKPRPEREKPALWIWGAGHVGRALAATLAPLDQHAITLIDVAEDRFPSDLPPGIDPLVASDPLRVVPRAPQDAIHLILTYSHDLDLALCDALLRHGFAQAGLIGSATKWARFCKRLATMGHTDTAIQQIQCPIGNPALGKHPQAIAIGVAAQLLSSQPAETKAARA